MGNYFTQGLILRHSNFREADRMVSIYTQDRGLVNVIAKGSRKINSKLAGNLEPFTLAEFMIVNGKRYDTVASSEVIDIFKNIKKDLVKIKLAFYFSNIFLNTVKELQKDNKIYEFILEIFKHIEHLDTKNKKNLNWLVWYYIWSYLKLSGYQPEVYKCLICKKDIEPNKTFINYHKGGLVCDVCAQQHNELNQVSVNFIKIIRNILNTDLVKLLNIKIDNETAKEFAKHTKKYYSYVFAEDINVPFFKSV
ncbi:MAG: DNA repair protein RecO [bacterium]|nr:DNA repair protein RecO [bacterium]